MDDSGTDRLKNKEKYEDEIVPSGSPYIRPPLQALRHCLDVTSSSSYRLVAIFRGHYRVVSKAASDPPVLTHVCKPSLIPTRRVHPPKLNSALWQQTFTPSIFGCRILLGIQAGTTLQP